MDGGAGEEEALHGFGHCVWCLLMVGAIGVLRPRSKWIFEVAVDLRLR